MCNIYVCDPYTLWCALFAFVFRIFGWRWRYMRRGILYKHVMYTNYEEENTYRHVLDNHGALDVDTTENGWGGAFDHQPLIQKGAQTCRYMSTLHAMCVYYHLLCIRATRINTVYGNKLNKLRQCVRRVPVCLACPWRCRRERMHMPPRRRAKCTHRSKYLHSTLYVHMQ